MYVYGAALGFAVAPLPVDAFLLMFAVSKRVRGHSVIMRAMSLLL